ncbi:glutathione peroxidase [Flavobacterium sp. J49]|uniref:glutathione peroxidase n=1 Tax=Flavobacterium sp. J49 TaxID=2718534 RepID=UPI0015931161|nr:glutathione peroxidase [Flavobacterium sp. J49]MBF6640816.1 glutathione peroxidase [Flavobacterium sp. J49]NIC02063.1 glutathione peroxidase [Flavobacterium sp. J49]
MKKLMLLSCGVLLLWSCQNNAQSKPVTNTTENNKEMNTVIKAQTIYQFKVKDLYGEEFDFASLKGKKILIVNTASECGLTPQYKDLEAIYKKYKDKNFVIVGFPANNFGAQEPGSNEQIAKFCEMNYGVTFPMMSKVSVKGEDKSEVYQFLTQKSKNGLQDSEVEWNFQKYLINEQGELVKVLSPRVLPTDAAIVGWINEK